MFPQTFEEFLRMLFQRFQPGGFQGAAPPPQRRQRPVLPDVFGRGQFTPLQGGQEPQRRSLPRMIDYRPLGRPMPMPMVDDGQARQRPINTPIDMPIVGGRDLSDDAARRMRDEDERRRRQMPGDDWNTMPVVRR